MCARWEEAASDTGWGRGTFPMEFPMEGRGKNRYQVPRGEKLEGTRDNRGACD